MSSFKPKYYNLKVPWTWTKTFVFFKVWAFLLPGLNYFYVCLKCSLNEPATEYASLPSASSLGPKWLSVQVHKASTNLIWLTACRNSWPSILSEMELAFSMMSCSLEKIWTYMARSFHSPEESWHLPILRMHCQHVFSFFGKCQLASIFPLVGYDWHFCFTRE